MAAFLQYNHHGRIPAWAAFEPGRNEPEPIPSVDLDREYDFQDLPFQPIGKYVVCMKRNCHGERFVDGLYYNAYECVNGDWMLETDNGTYMLVEKSDFEFVSVFKNGDWDF